MAAVTQCAGGANAPAVNAPAVPTCQRFQRASGHNAPAVTRQRSTRQRSRASGQRASGHNAPAVTTRQRSQRASGQRAAAVSTRCSGLNALQLVAAINYGAAVNPCGGGESLRRRSIFAAAAAVNQCSERR